jgi:hypothetical protein
VLGVVRGWLRRALSRTRLGEAGGSRRLRVSEEVPSDRFVAMLLLMVLFFVGLVGLEMVHMVWMGSWNDAVFNGIMLVVGTIVGAVWGRSAG